jgi:hypothetical protein
MGRLACLHHLGSPGSKERLNSQAQFLRHARFLIAFTNVSSIRVCQPGPLALKCSTTSEDNRSDQLLGRRLLRTTLAPAHHLSAANQVSPLKERA